MNGGVYLSQQEVQELLKEIWMMKYIYLPIWSVACVLCGAFLPYMADWLIEKAGDIASWIKANINI